MEPYLVKEKWTRYGTYILQHRNYQEFLNNVKIVVLPPLKKSNDYFVKSLLLVLKTNDYFVRALVFLKKQRLLRYVFSYITVPYISNRYSLLTIQMLNETKDR